MQRTDAELGLVVLAREVVAVAQRDLATPHVQDGADRQVAVLVVFLVHLARLKHKTVINFNRGYWVLDAYLQTVENVATALLHRTEDVENSSVSLLARFQH